MGCAVARPMVPRLFANSFLATPMPESSKMSVGCGVGFVWDKFDVEIELRFNFRKVGDGFFVTDVKMLQS